MRERLKTSTGKIEVGVAAVALVVGGIIGLNLRENDSSPNQRIELAGGDNPTTTLKKLATTTSTTVVSEASLDFEKMVKMPFAGAAEKRGSSWALSTSDEEEVVKDLSSAEGFTPDATLKVSDLSAKGLDPVEADAGDFQKYLNTPRGGFGPLAGYTDGTNDYNQYKDHQSGPQVPAFSWEVHTGLFAELPGIGRVEGGEGRAVMVMILNRTERVYRFPTNSVTVLAGFQGWGRIWNGDAEPVRETERKLVNHYRNRLGTGVPETGFIGQCDQAEENCDEVTVVSVERLQWGNNEDGTPRDQFRLIRAETVPTAK